MNIFQGIVILSALSLGWVAVVAVVVLLIIFSDDL